MRVPIVFFECPRGADGCTAVDGKMTRTDTKKQLLILRATLFLPRVRARLVLSFKQDMAPSFAAVKAVVAAIRGLLFLLVCGIQPSTQLLLATSISPSVLSFSIVFTFFLCQFLSLKPR